MPSGYTIRLSQRSDLPLLPDIERDAARRFAACPEHLGSGAVAAREVHSQELLLAAHADGRLWVAADAGARPVAFALVLDLGLFAHLEELAVLSAHGRRGLGSELLESVCAWAYTRGFSAVTTSAFRDVPWGAPFYARHGFVVLPASELPRELVRVVERERSAGLRSDLRAILQREV